MDATLEKILEKAKGFIKKFFEENISKEYVYHDLEHTQQVYRAVELISAKTNLEEKDVDILKLAALFHDTGFKYGPDNHEENSVKIFELFCETTEVNDSIKKVIKGAILATKMPQNPKSTVEAILCDADLAHLGNEYYWDRNDRVRKEIIMRDPKMINEDDWIAFELKFMNAHQYVTKAAMELYGETKVGYIKALEIQQKRLDPKFVKQENQKKKKKKKKKRKQKDVGRGVETMFRTAYRTHVNLSSIADNKANIMLSINALIISILLPQLIFRVDSTPNIILPSAMIMSTNLLSIIFATLATRPKVNTGTISLEEIQNKKGNLIFFGNFFKMEVKEYIHGMNHLIAQQDYLYSTMTRDLYFLGKVLAKKYRYLTYCYNIFMIGMVISVIVFALIFLNPMPK